MKFENQPAEFFIEGVLKGDIAILSRAITLVESMKNNHQSMASAIIDGVINKTGNSFRLGVTGVPGVGKSTFIESFGKEILKHGHRLAVLAIDPSSSISKGSILGDKTRMEELSASDNVFIRPSPSSGNLGGVTRATYETILLCEAAGFDYIIVETVGVGQSEIAVSRLTDFFMLLMLAGAGDELQGIKRGIMELADSLIITKADGDNVEKARSARAEFAHAMHFLQPPHDAWTPRSMVCSALTGEGMSEIYQMISEYRNVMVAGNYFREKRRVQQLSVLKETLDQEIVKDFYLRNGVEDRINVLRTKDSINPFAEAARILKEQR